MQSYLFEIPDKKEQSAKPGLPLHCGGQKIADIHLGLFQNLRSFAGHPSGELWNADLSENRANEGCAHFDPFRGQLSSNFCIEEIRFRRNSRIL